MYNERDRKQKENKKKRVVFLFFCSLSCLSVLQNKRDERRGKEEGSLVTSVQIPRIDISRKTPRRRESRADPLSAEGQRQGQTADIEENTEVEKKRQGEERRQSSEC